MRRRAWGMEGGEGGEESFSELPQRERAAMAVVPAANAWTKVAGLSGYAVSPPLRCFQRFNEGFNGDLRHSITSGVLVPVLSPPFSISAL